MGDIQKELDNRAKAVLETHGIPNIAAVIVRDNGATVLSTAQGIRDTSKSASDASNKVKKTDHFNVGSISKPITGFLIACLIKKGLLSWTTKISDVFPEFKSKAFRARCGMNENFLDTKVFELMSHTTGMTGWYYYALNNDTQRQRDTDPFRFLWDMGIQNGGNSRDKEWKTMSAVVYQRYLYTILCMKKEKYKFNSSRNFKFENTGRSGYGSMCTIAAAMVERKTGKPFETVVNELLSDTLDLQIKFGKLPNGMQFHSYDDAQDKYVPAPHMVNDFQLFASKNITGGIHVTVTGMAQFIKYNLRALDHSNIFSVSQYQTPVTDATRGGLFLGGGSNNEPLNHNGATGASLADMHIYHQSGRGFGVMLSSGGGASDQAQADMMREIKDIHANWNSLK
jgi:CubicO group peptidase (beta-lactamase class C family)